MDYKELLNKETFLSWINEIAKTDDDLTIRSAAEEIFKMVNENYAVQFKPYHEKLYIKYKFRLYPTNTPFGTNYLRNILYSYVNKVPKVVGLIQPITDVNKQIVARQIVEPTPSPTPLPDLANYANNQLLDYLKNITIKPTSKLIYSTIDNSTGNYIRNVDCWSYKLRQQMTCISPWSKVNGIQGFTNDEPTNRLHGTLVTKRHILYAAHNPFRKNTVIRFITADNQIVDRTIIGVDNGFEYADVLSDTGIALLDSDVPDSITPCYVFSENYKDYLYDKEYEEIINPQPSISTNLNDIPSSYSFKPRIGAFVTNQFHNFFICDFYGGNIRSSNIYGASEYFNSIAPLSNPIKDPFSRIPGVDPSAIAGDSGSPVFIMVDEKFVLLAVASSTSEEIRDRTQISNLIPYIEERMEHLENICGVKTGYKLNRIDLSKFRVKNKNTEGLYLSGYKGNLVQPDDYPYPTPTPTPSIGTIEPKSIVAEEANKEIYDFFDTPFKKLTKSLFKKIDHTSGLYERNEQSFINSMTQQSTCVSVWNSGDSAQLFQKRCTLITKRHVIMVPERKITIGSTIRFVTADNQIINRTLIDTKDISEIGGGLGGMSSITIGLLDSDVPDSITPCYFLPSNYKDYFNTYNPVFVGDPYSPENEFWVNPRPGCIIFAERSNLVALLNLKSFYYNTVFFTAGMDIHLKYPWSSGGSIDSFYFPTPYGWTSPDNKTVLTYNFVSSLLFNSDYPTGIGSPVFLKLQNKLILLTHYDVSTVNKTNGTWFGSNLSEATGDINTLIGDIDSENSINTGYTVNQINLSSYSLSVKVTPTPTISSTPQITPSISVSPSLTPSISITPSITPTLTPTPTSNFIVSEQLFYPNIKLYSYRYYQPRPVNVYVAELNLNELTNIKITGKSGSYETVRVTTKTFVDQNDGLIGMNLHYFSPSSNPDNTNNYQTNLRGYCVSGSTVISTFKKQDNPQFITNVSYAVLGNAPAINIDQNNTASIVTKNNLDPSGNTVNESVTVFNTFAGSAQVITNGSVSIPTYDESDPYDYNSQYLNDIDGYNNSNSWYDLIRARGMIGINQIGNKLYFAVCENNPTGVGVKESHGMSVSELANVLISQHNVYNALNMDGGGSTSLVLRDPSDGIVKYVNQIEYDQSPRRVGSNISVTYNDRSYSPP